MRIENIGLYPMLKFSKYKMSSNRRLLIKDGDPSHGKDLRSRRQIKNRVMIL